MKNEHATTHTRASQPNIYKRIRASHLFQKLFRVFQFLSSIISLGLFSARLCKIVRVVRRASTSNGAVEGILAAAVAYTLLSMIIRLILKKRSPPTWLRWLWIVLDIAFTIAFIVIAVLTSPGRNGSSGPCHKYRGIRIEPNGLNCSLPWGTFLLAILSTFLHFITAVFNEVKDHHRKQRGAVNGGDY